MDLPWVEKYRPTSLNDLIGHDEITKTINRFVSENKLPHLLLYGPAGTGKTSTILAVAKQIYKPSEFKSMILELNASDDRGIGVVREQILSFASTRTLFSNVYKMVILDEADSMTKDAQNALRRIIEKYSENTRFCLICNYLSKITPAIQSRCTRFRFAPVPLKQMEPRLLEIASKESVNITEDGCRAIFKFANGDMRKALNILQSCSLAVDKVDETSVYSCVGYPTPKEMKLVLDWCLSENVETAMKNILQLKTEKSIALQDLITEVVPLVMRSELSDTFKSLVLIRLADIEKNMAIGATERLQLGAFIGTFVEGKHELAQES